MPVNNNARDGLLKLLMQNANFANVGDATGLRGSSSAGVFWMSLHTADPGASGNQGTNETTYGGYLRISVTRDTMGWTFSGHTISPTSTLAWPACTSGTATITHVGFGTASSGAGELLWSGPLTPNIAVAASIIPEATIASTIDLN